MTVSSRNDLLRRFVRSSMPVLFDVGANQGQTSRALRQIFPNSVLHMFEPDATLFKALNDMFGSSETHINLLALSKNSDERTLIRYSDSQANSFLPLDENGYYIGRGLTPVSEETVQCSTLDRYMKECSVEAIDFLKIDTQGHSLEVLQGADSALTQGAIHLLQVEVTLHGFYKEADSFAEILSFMEHRNYRVFTLLHGDSEQIGHVFYDFATGEVRGFDVIFVRDGRHDI